MNKQDNIFPVNYIETPRTIDSPVRIDKILRERMKAFLATRKGGA